MVRFTKSVCIFLAAAALLQCAFLLFLSPDGIKLFHPLAIRVVSEKVNTKDNIFPEYYSLRSAIQDASAYYIAFDETVHGIYGAVFDYLRFLQRDAGVNRVVLDVSTDDAAKVEACLTAADYAAFEETLALLDKDEEFKSFISLLYEFNASLPVKWRLHAEPFSGGGIADTGSWDGALPDDGAVRAFLIGSGQVPAKADAQRAGVLCADILCYNCRTAGGTVVTDIALPFCGSGEAIWFADLSRLDGYYRYYRLCAGENGENLEDIYSPALLIYSNGGTRETTDAED
jgi:hypothetical protein